MSASAADPLRRAFHCAAKAVSYGADPEATRSARHGMRTRTLYP